MIDCFFGGLVLGLLNGMIIGWFLTRAYSGLRNRKKKEDEPTEGLPLVIQEHKYKKQEQTQEKVK